MRLYEIMCVFTPQEEEFKKGLDAVRQELQNLHAEISKEEDMGVRKIAGTIAGHTHAHYLYFLAKFHVVDVQVIREKLSAISSLLRILVLKKIEKTEKIETIEK